MKKIGLLGGSFDPPHFGHIHLAIRLKEAFDLDGVIFIPAACSPFKVGNPALASGALRLQMVKAAIDGIDAFDVCDFELKSGEAISYTIDTVRHLIENDMKEGKKIEYHLLLGQDVVHGLARWKQSLSLLDLAPPLIGTRAFADTQKIEGLSPEDTKKILKGYVQIPSLEISSTEIRTRLKSGLYVGHLLCPKVLDTIYHHRLYSSEL